MSTLSLKARDGERPGEAIVHASAPGDSLPDTVSYAIRRRGYPLGNLGPGGWQIAEATLAPRLVRRVADGIELELGPDVVQHLERGNYEMTLSGPGLPEPQTGVLAWSNVRAFQPGQARRRAGRLAAAEMGGTTAAASGSASRVPDPLADTILSPPLIAETPLGMPLVETADVLTATETVTDGSVEVPQPRPIIQRYWPVGAAAVVLAAIAAFFLLRPSPPPPPPPPAPVADTTPPANTTPAPVVPPPAPVTTTGTATTTTTTTTTAGTPTGTPIEQARQFMSVARTPAQIYQRAVDFQNQGAMDAAVPLFRRAADAGDARSADALGRLYDPADLGSSRRTQMPQANADFAAMWYQRAVAAGDATAAQDLQNLTNWARTRAAQGDQGAADLLAKLQP